MRPEDLRQIEELYHSARERGTAVLDDVAPSLRREVEKLLAQDSEDAEDAGKLLDQSAAELLIQMPVPEVEPGSLLGPYKIEAPLGEGGMGQVFRARDTRLGRTVAIKILKEWSGRFEKESRAIAALNHPNICTLHDVGANYLVMELIQGETLTERLKRGSLPPEQVVQIGKQIAEAVAAAHSQGIIHRDLKPGNVMLTKVGVKVLDFGLAKTAADPAVSVEGVLLGTPAYMAPELFEGAAADARTDIYALGLMLREMLTGKYPERMDKVPPVLARLVNRCIERDPEERWQSVADLKWELEWAALPSAPSQKSSWRNPLAGVAFAAIALAALAYFMLRRPSPPPQPARLSIVLPDRARAVSMALSPDGRSLALVLVRDGRQQIWVRSLDALEMTPLEGTDGALHPFWSPDGRSIAFFADARLKKIDRAGGPVQTLCVALAALGGTWGAKGDILVAGQDLIKRVSPVSGEVSLLPESAGVRSGAYPSFLPDGEHYLATRGDGVWLGATHTADARKLVPDVTSAQFMAPPPGSRIGAVLFERGNALMALPFDVKRLESAGDAVSVAQELAGGPDRYRLAAGSTAGVLAYVSGQPTGWQYVWRDREGKNLGSYPNAGAVAMISPDGKKLLGEHFDGGVWVTEFAAGTGTRLTFGGGANPVWSPDGKYIAYGKVDDGIYRKLASGEGDEELLTKVKNLAAPKSWSPDGKYLVYAQIDFGVGSDLMAIAVNGDRKPFPVVQTAAAEDQGQFSPDGRWLAYTSNESGQGEVYVIPFPQSGGAKWLVSRGGGVLPRWRRDGKKLFYISADSRMMEVDVTTRPVFRSGTPRPLFQTNIVDTGIRSGPMSWDVAPDGNRFLIITPNVVATPAVTVALNWKVEGAK
ncbi:protein kinase domain-containing protein [Occallatibacter riparius]|uniref:Protein kinase n=1 Tax=Occallatibacter riparius TaxID=1002689 RepID=A0A9J7BHD8_9BACT|nr:protein kinase [Occallatibacter riparius]UWZ82380.1 protein kinase [Occallatibacter riparius]